VLRSLIKDPLFKGRVTGLDLSAAFIGAANRLTSEEGLPVERISFA
jgi:ubiquinone/menaquinone biosynthesis C-methylase UbiE